MNIGEAALAAGVSAKMVRHYEQIGLLPPAARSEAGYRRYGERDVSLLRFIRQARLLGFSMAQIADLVGLWSDSGRSSREVRALASAHLDELDRKMRELAAMRDGLQRLVSACHGDDSPHCAILDELSQHGEAPPSAPSALRPRPPRSAAPAPDSHADLMAWTLQLHRR